MATPIKPTRADFAKFLPDQRSIRAFEQLFDVIPNDLITLLALIEEVGIETVSAMARAESNSAALLRIAEALELLTSVPAASDVRRPVLDTIDMDRFAPVGYKRARMWWNDQDDTLNIGHQYGVVQQVGQETYMHVENDTGSPIPNGSVIGFAGVNGYIKCSPYIADGSLPSEYFIGVLTQDLADGEIGMATLYGRVRGFDTTGTSAGEVWAKGDILYASPTIAGNYTNVRPTAPDAVIIVAAVMVVDATDGEIMVRTTVPIGLAYADYYSTVDQVPAAANTAYNVTFNGTGAEQGVSLVSSTQLTVNQAGLYQINVKLQATSSTGSSSKIFAWIAINGTDVPNSGADFTIKANGDTKLISYMYQVSLIIGDYVEVRWAADTTSLRLDAIPATAFSPAASSAAVFLTQIQL
jgi:hypothetical protein